VRHDLAVGRLEEALAKVRRYEANWQPRAEHVSQPGSIEGAIRKVEARAAEAEARYEQLRSGRRGNLGPSLDPTPRAGQADLPSRVFDGPSWINAYRVTNNMPDLFEHPMWPYDKGTVAVTEFNGKLIFGVNSGAPGYSDAEWGAARRLRDDLAEKHPGILGAWNRGQVPNEAFFHAEPNILFRAANENGGTLAGRRLEVQTDRDLCNSCQTVLPLISPGLGDPIVTFTNYRTGKSWLLQNGSIRRIK
jgi:hypothetical protein